MFLTEKMDLRYDLLDVTLPFTGSICHQNDGLEKR